MHVVGWILLGLAGLILLALCLPFAVKVELLQTWRVTLKLFGFLPVYTFTPQKGDTSSEQEEPPAEQAAVSKNEEKPKPSLKEELKALYRRDGVRGVLHFFSQLTHLLTDTLAHLARYVSVRKLALCIRVGGEEADHIATTHGGICAALYTTLTALENVIPIRRREMAVTPDFLADTTVVRLRTVLWIWPLGALGVGVRALCKAVPLWLKLTPSPSKTQVVINQGRTS